MAVQECCPICLEPLPDGICCWGCDHLVHQRCIRNSRPIPCPICRSPWAVYTCSYAIPDDPSTRIEIDRLLHGQRAILHRAAPYAVGRRPPPRPLMPPRDVMFLCCHDGDDPLGTYEVAERAMSYSPHLNEVSNRWLDFWHCEVCGLLVDRRDVPAFPPDHLGRCSRHGRHTVVVDCWSRPFRIVGQACTRYGVPIATCNGGFDDRNPPSCIPRFRPLRGTRIPHWVFVGETSNPELTEYQRQHVSQYQRIDDIPIQ